MLLRFKIRGRFQSPSSKVSIVLLATSLVILSSSICVMHMFGANQLTKRIAENGWYVSMNTIVLRGKKQKKVVRDMPLEKLMLETDSPWLGLDGKRNDPLSMKIVAEKIAEIKKMTFEEVDRITTENAIGFFKLNL